MDRASHPRMLEGSRPLGRDRSGWPEQTRGRVQEAESGEQGGVRAEEPDFRSPCDGTHGTQQGKGRGVTPGGSLQKPSEGWDGGGAGPALALGTDAGRLEAEARLQREDESRPGRDKWMRGEHKAISVDVAGPTSSRDPEAGFLVGSWASFLFCIQV